MRVLGIDPGTVRTGWGIVQNDGQRLRGVAAGVIALRESETLELRLMAIFEGLSEVIATHAPTVCAVEDIFFAKYPAAAMKLGHARGVALVAAARGGLVVTAYPPALVKRTVSGRGNADKQQVARMVGAMLGWAELPSVDATDALAVAITHLSAARLPSQLTTTLVRARVAASSKNAPLPDARASARAALDDRKKRSR